MATAPWERKRPARPKTKLTAEYKELARERARRAGRRYPNLIDNMYAAQLQEKRRKR